MDTAHYIQVAPEQVGGGSFKGIYIYIYIYIKAIGLQNVTVPRGQVPIGNGWALCDVNLRAVNLYDAVASILVMSMCVMSICGELSESVEGSGVDWGTEPSSDDGVASPFDTRR